MVFSVSFPTRHTDTFTNTGFVHAGVLLALTELAYNSFELYCKLQKPDHVIAVQTETHAIYHSPLPWQENTTIEIQTINVATHSFQQEFSIRSELSNKAIATFMHKWVWLDLVTGHAIPLSTAIQERLLLEIKPD
tara:strand:+ start:538 stop:942 length:405 start_codon:yes stop_codon:yes gene_type:complete